MARLAVLIDGDNFPHRLLPELIAQAQALGQVVVCRAFVNLHDSQRWQAIMDPNGSTELVRQPRHRPRKSSVDMTLAIHAMDLLHTTALDGFCIASNDSDFVPLVLRLQQQGVKVYGFGTAAKSRALYLACDKYYSLGEGTAGEAAARHIDAGRLALIRDAVLLHADKDGWASVAAVATFLRRKSLSYAENRWGFATLKKALLSTRRYEVQSRQGQPRTRAIPFAPEGEENGTPPPDRPVLG